MSEANQQNYTPDEAAARLRASASTLARWRCKGIGPKFIKSGGRVLYRENDLAAYESDNIQSTTRPE